VSIIMMQKPGFYSPFRKKKDNNRAKGIKHSIPIIANPPSGNKQEVGTNANAKYIRDHFPNILCYKALKEEVINRLKLRTKHTGFHETVSPKA
jgi:hypothetical protein